MNSLNLLLRNKPSWLQIEGRQSEDAEVVASPPAAGNRSGRSYYLRLQCSAEGGVNVREQTKRRQLPAFCLERHINPDGTFCLHYGSEAEIANDEAARFWWSSLATYLDYQRYAEKHGYWPLEGGLSHGEAADEQFAMEELADRLGWKDEILISMFRNKGWLFEHLPRVSKTLSRVLNSKAPCPRGCTHKHGPLRARSCSISDCEPSCKKQHKPILRADCPNRSTVEKLILHEHRRRKIEAQIVKKVKSNGHKCCGTMKDCPLRDLEA